MAATLAAYDVSFEEATNCAIDLSTEIGLWDRPLGLAFVWGALIEDWLDKLLPPSEVRIPGPTSERRGSERREEQSAANT